MYLIHNNSWNLVPETLPKQFKISPQRNNHFPLIFSLPFDQLSINGLVEWFCCFDAFVRSGGTEYHLYG